MINIKGLYHKYIREYYALFDINLKIEKGEKVALFGGEHSGKTSLIRILAKLEKPSKGEIYIDNKCINKVNYRKDISVGYIPVCPIFLNNKTVYQNIKFILKTYEKDKQLRDEKTVQIIKQFNLENIADKKIKNLDLYNKYVVSVARLSVRNLDLLLIDSIFDGLEKKQINVLSDLIVKNLYNKENTVLVATASEEIACKLAKRNIYFKSGSLVESLQEENN